MHIPKWLIATAAALFVALIAAVAFFIGRQSSPRPEAPMTVSAPAQEPAPVKDPAAAPEPNAAVATLSGAAMTSPIAASPSGATATQSPASTPTAPSISSPPAAAVAASPVNAEARARVSAYFKQMEALESAGSGDPESFANTIVQGATSGDFSGLDDLVRISADAERRAAALQPPPECAEYHQMAVKLLQDSRAMMTAIRDGLKRNDTSALEAMSASAQSMKARSDALAAAEKSLRARFGL